MRRRKGIGLWAFADVIFFLMFFPLILAFWGLKLFIKFAVITIKVCPMLIYCAIIGMPILGIIGIVAFIAQNIWPIVLAVLLFVIATILTIATVDYVKKKKGV